jgi:hypothetical protein
MIFFTRTLNLWPHLTFESSLVGSGSFYCRLKVMGVRMEISRVEKINKDRNVPYNWGEQSPDTLGWICRLFLFMLLSSACARVFIR